MTNLVGRSYINIIDLSTKWIGAIVNKYLLRNFEMPDKLTPFI